MQIILHIGQQKTASTLIQAALRSNRKNLAAQGVLYPAALGHLSQHLYQLVYNSRKLPAPRATMIENLRAELSGPYDRAVLSDETVYLFSRRRQAALKRLLGDYATSWRILCYLRRPEEHIVSYYQQEVRGFEGLYASFDDFYTERLHSEYYRYADLMDRWAGMFGRDAIEVRVFHRTTLPEGPTRDFVRWIGVEPGTLSLAKHAAVNESFDRINTEIMRFLYRSRKRNPDPLRGHDIREIERRLQALNTDDRLRLDHARAKRMHEHLRRDHERLAERYLSPEHAAVLLAPPVETPPQPPVDPDAMHARMMAVFGDAALAGSAVDEMESPTAGHRRGIGWTAMSMLPPALLPLVYKARRRLRAR